MVHKKFMEGYRAGRNFEETELLNNMQTRDKFRTNVRAAYISLIAKSIERNEHPFETLRSLLDEGNESYMFLGGYLAGEAIRNLKSGESVAEAYNFLKRLGFDNGRIVNSLLNQYNRRDKNEKS